MVGQQNGWDKLQARRNKIDNQASGGLSKSLAGKLTIMVGVEDLKCCKAAQGLLERIYTKGRKASMDTRQNSILRLCQSCSPPGTYIRDPRDCA